MMRSRVKQLAMPNLLIGALLLLLILVGWGDVVWVGVVVLAVLDLLVLVGGLHLPRRFRSRPPSDIQNREE
jgi:hypothetical protein